jgi:hypothetical protein
MMLRTQSSTSNPFIRPHLAPQHLKYLAERGVSSALAKAAGLSSMDRYAIEEFTDVRAVSQGLGFLYLPEGKGDYCRVRLDEPIKLSDGSTMRYATPKGELVRPYIAPPAVLPTEYLQDATCPIFITEAPTKSLACIAAGFPAIGLGGVYTGQDSKRWKHRRELRLHPELRRRIVWVNRIVFVAFDANRALNRNVLQAERRLCQALANEGASVYVVIIPLTHEGLDQGPDDFLVAHGKEAFARLVQAAKPWLEVHQPVKDMPKRYREQFAVAEKRASLLQVTSLEEARALRDLEEAEARETIGRITLARITMGAGKSHGMIESSQKYEEPTTIYTPSHDLSRELYQKATQKLNVKARRIAAACSPKGFIDDQGKSRCLQHEDDILGELMAGKSCGQICAACPFSDKDCTIWKGLEGDENALLAFSVHDSPQSGFINVDERLSLYKKQTITIQDLEALLYDTTIANDQLSVFTWAAQRILTAIQQEIEGDPLDENLRQALLEVAPRDQTGRIVAQVVRHGVMIGSPSSPARNERNRAAWAVGVWLLRAALFGAKVVLKDCVARDTLRRPLQGAFFETLSPLAAKLKEEQRGFLVDATATEADARALAKATGLEVRFVAIEVLPKVEVTRRWCPSQRAGRDTLMPHGRIHLPTFTRLVNGTIEELKKTPWAKNILLVSYLRVATLLRSLWEVACQRKALTPEELPYLKAIIPLFELIEARSGGFGVLHFGALRGKDGFTDADAAISWGAPYGPVEEEGDEAFSLNQELAACELAQFFGRLRLLVRTTPALLICMGDVLPGDWKPEEFETRYTPQGRPFQTSKDSVWKDALALLLEKQGLRSLAREVGVHHLTLANYRDGKRQPGEDLAALLVSLANSVPFTETSIVCRGNESANSLVREVEPIGAEPSIHRCSNVGVTQEASLPEQKLSGYVIAKATIDLPISEVEPIDVEPSLSIYSNYVATPPSRLTEQSSSILKAPTQEVEPTSATPTCSDFRVLQESSQELIEKGLTVRQDEEATPISRNRALHVRPPLPEAEWLASQWFFESEEGEEPEEIPPP